MGYPRAEELSRLKYSNQRAATRSAWPFILLLVSLYVTGIIGAFAWDLMQSARIAQMDACAILGSASYRSRHLGFGN